MTLYGKLVVLTYTPQQIRLQGLFQRYFSEIAVRIWGEGTRFNIALKAPAELLFVTGDRNEQARKSGTK